MSHSSAYDGIDLMLNCEDPEERDELTKKWRDHKLQELNFVGTVGALLSTCLSSTGSWPQVLNNGQNKPWTVRALWFSGLVFALFAVMASGIQSMRLHRLSSHRDGLAMIRAGLAGGSGGSKKGGGSAFGWRRRLPLRFQVYAWDAGQAFLLLSVIFMIGGITVLVWVSAEFGPGKPGNGGWWDDNSKMAVTFTAVLGFAIVVLVASQAVLMGGTGSDEEEEEEEDGRIQLPN